MNVKWNWKRIAKGAACGIVGAASSLLCALGYYPLVPAFYAACCLEKGRSVLLYIGLFAGMGFRMPVGSMIKYLFLLLIVNIGIRFYLWANKRCSGVMAAVIAGVSTSAMNCSGMALVRMDRNELILGLSEGVMVFGGTLLFYYALQALAEVGESFSEYIMSGTMPQEQENYDTQGKIGAFAEAVGGLSSALAAMGQVSAMSGAESVAVLEQEITGKLCAACDGCAICWEDKGEDLSEKIRRMLQAVVEHRPREAILEQRFMEDCPRYSGMVEEAIWAFSRMELNEAWYRRLRENRMVIANQLDAMSELMQDWTKSRKSMDAASKALHARIRFEAQEKGLIVEQLHIYEENERMVITANVCSKWGGGIPSKNYIRALEKACGKQLRPSRESKSILTKEATAMTVYEDTCFYVLSGVSAREQDGAVVSGDNFSMFTLENGRFYICLSDGMGTGPDAGKESDMVVELMEKFMEAGFSGETAIRMMNSAMVLQGENNSYSTLDFAVIDLYSGMLEMTKIGAAASFIRRGDTTSRICCNSLPAGVDAGQELKPVKTALGSGDFLVMVTDGVLEYLHVKNPEEKLAEIISEIRTENAGVMAKEVMERVMLFTGGHALDDMTILITGIWEK